MTADVELLPLYAELQGHPKLEIVKHYTRANVAHAVAAKDAEIEALVHDLEQTRANVVAEHEARIEAEVRAEQLVEALRLIESAKDRGLGIDYAKGCAQNAIDRHAGDGEGR